MLIMLALIAGNEIVYKGAHDGLMLWFNSVIPLLLPFMLMSSLIVEKINLLPEKKRKSHAVIITLFTGLFCGYPLGAKNSAEFVKSNVYSKETGGLLLPLCNNCSPMFLSGYILRIIPESRISFIYAIILIYFPYIIVTGGIILFSYISGLPDVKRNQSVHLKNDFSKTSSLQNKCNNTGHIMEAVIQITYVGFYIIICSIISEFIMSFNTDFKEVQTIISGMTEITQGTALTAASPLFCSKCKAALILSLASFGGVSSILQTNKVLEKSGLSIYRYIIIKTICASATYGLALIFL